MFIGAYNNYCHACIDGNVFVTTQFTTKQLERLSKKAEKEQRAQQAKVKKVTHQF